MNPETKPNEATQTTGNQFPRMHASIYVRDIAASVAFYERWWQQKAEKVKPGYAKFHLARPGLVFSMVENKDRAGGNFGHMGIQVGSVEELAQWKSVAEQAGIATFTEEQVNCCYAIQDKFWVEDPDGTHWEVYYFHADAEFNDPRDGSAASQNEACCSTAFDVAALPKQRGTSAALSDLPRATIEESSQASAPASACSPGSGCC